MKVDQNKPHSIHLRLTDAQYKYCFENAELLGIGVSDFLRMVINGLVVQTKRQMDANAEKATELANEMLGDLERYEDNTSNK